MSREEKETNAGYSLWYLHPRLYDIGMLLINGSFYLKIYKEIAAQIPENATVLDIGAGPCTLQRYLKKSCICQEPPVKEREDTLTSSCKVMA